MNRIITVLILATVALLVLTACGDDDPNGDTLIDQLTADLTANGATVIAGDSVSQPFIDVDGQTLLVNGESLQVFDYGSPEPAQEAVDSIDPSGSTVGTTSVLWIAPPHFYRYMETLVIIYVGDDDSTIRRLEAVAGPQFAGAGTIVELTNVLDDDDPQVKMEAYIALMSALRDTLANVGNPDAGGEALADAVDIANEIGTYTPFFQGLSDRAMVALLAVYGTEMQPLNAEVAEHAIRVTSTMTGTEELVAALQLGPAFALESTSTPSDREVIQGLDPVQ